MGTETDNNNTRSSLVADKKCRSLDVFYTPYNTKLCVQDGELIEEKIQPCSPLKSSDDESPGQKNIKELNKELELVNRKCEVYRANLLLTLNNIEDHKQLLAMEVHNMKLSLNDAT